MMHIRKLGEVAEVVMGQAPAGSSYNSDGVGIPLVAGAGDFGELYPKVKKYTNQPSKISQPGDIILGIRASIGEKVLSDKEYCLGRGVAGVRAADSIDSQYLWHWLEYVAPVLKSKGHGATFLQVNKNDICSLEIPLLRLEEQKRIAKILDAADALRAKRRESIAQLDALLQSTFLDLFGDPVANPKEWPIVSLSDYGSFKNGLNYKNGERGVGVRCLGVGDFGSRSILSDVDKLALIQLGQLPSSEYFLKDGDLVFVRSNGNRQLVGRCLAVYPGLERATYSGFCIRYRLEDSGLCQAYLTHLFRMPSFRKAMLQGGQGANIQNINQKTLSSLKIPMPHEDYQKRFSDALDSIEGLRSLLANHFGELEGLFTALQNKAFSGEL